MSVDSFIRLENVSLTFPIVGRRIREVVTTEAAATGMAGISRKVKSVTSVKALHDVSFQLEPGDRMALVGRNGAGKTTLLKVISGIYPPTTGTVETQGKISTLFQMGMGMQPSATGYRNIFLQGLVHGYTKKQIREMVDDVAEFTELGKFLNLPVNTYSQGMALRLNFAIATSLRPDILIMDEWLSAGDATFRNKAAERMNEVFERAGIAILASHNSRLLRRVCNKALWLDSGHIMGFGPTKPLLAQMDKYYKRETQNEMEDDEFDD